MSDAPSTLAAARPALRAARQRSSLLLVCGPLPPPLAAGLEELASSEGLTWGEVCAATWGLLPDGVVRGGLDGYLGGGAPVDESFCRDAVGEGAGALAAWRRLVERWTGAGPDALELAPDDQRWRSASEVLARILAAVGDVEPRALLVRDAGALDDGSLRAFAALLAGREAPGWTLILQQDGQPSPSIERLTQTLERVDEVVVARLELDASPEDDGPSLPKRGSAVELLDVLGAAPVPLPSAVVGSTALSQFRGCSPRSGWLDLQGLLDAGRARQDGPLLRLIGEWTPTTDEGSVLAQADCRALRAAVAEVLDDDDPLLWPLVAGLALAGHEAAGPALARAAGRRALARGDAGTAVRWFDRAIGGDTTELALLRARAARLAGAADVARRITTEALRSATGSTWEGELQFEAGLAAIEVDRAAAAKGHLEQAATLATASGDLDVLAAARLAHGRLLEEAGDFGPAARLLGEATQACERDGAMRQAARAFAARAVCMGKAGAAERALKELGLARERAADPEDPHPAVLDVRILMGVVFRDSGSRESARKALALAARKAAEHADPLREAEARLMLSRFFLEAIPVKGKERGEALRDGRTSAEIVVQLARGMGRPDLEAEGEALLGELSWRAEDWPSALESLGRQQALWKIAGRAGREVDVAIRRSRLAGRQHDWKVAFDAANQALMLATRRRLPEQTAQAQLARGEALEKLDRAEEALAAVAEAQRILSGLGEAFAGQAAAAEERARRLVASGR
jgi:tetratricopeptide (TPR) repeat protein